MLRAAVRHCALKPEAAEDVGHWAHGGGFSLHAEVLIETGDRRGLERLLRYRARPALASERLSERGDERVHYTKPKPRPDGQTALTLAPLELLDCLAALIPPPRRHRHHYHGVFAPLRALVTARAGRTLVPTLPANRAATGRDTGVAVVAAPLAQRPDPSEAATPTPARRRAAYLLVNIEITDHVGFEEYRKAVGATIVAHGDRYLTRGGATEVLEGEWMPKRVVILEFADVAQLRAWYHSPEYQPLLKLRQRTAKTDLVVIAGG